MKQDWQWVGLVRDNELLSAGKYQHNSQAIAQSSINIMLFISTEASHYSSVSLILMSYTKSITTPKTLQIY